MAKIKRIIKKSRSILKQFCMERKHGLYIAFHKDLTTTEQYTNYTKRILNLPYFKRNLRMSQSQYAGTNLAAIPAFWTNTGWGIGSTIGGGAAADMCTYPVTQGGQTCIKVSPNAYYISTGDGGGVADCEMDGVWTSINVGDHIYWTAQIWTGSSSVGDNGNPLLGARIALDFYGPNGRICEIATPTGIPSYPNYPASMAQCTVSPDSNGFVTVTLDFIVQSQYEADPWGGYTAGTMVTPTSFVPWFAWYSSNINAETASFWIASTTLYINPTTPSGNNFTFGQTTTDYTTIAYLNANEKACAIFTANATGTLNSLSAVLLNYAINTNSIAALYAVNSDGTLGALIATTQPIALGPNESLAIVTWPFSTPPTVINGTKYGLTVLCDQGYQIYGIPGGTAYTNTNNYSSGKTTTDTVGSTAYSGASNVGIYVTKITPTQSGVLSSLGINLAVAAGNIRIGLYSSVVNGVLSGLIAQSASTPAVTGFNDLAVSGGNIVAGTPYYLAFQCDNSTCAVYYDSAGTYYIASAPYGSFPDPSTAYWGPNAGEYNVRITYATSISGFSNPFGAATTLNQTLTIYANGTTTPITPTQTYNAVWIESELTTTNYASIIPTLVANKIKYAIIYVGGLNASTPSAPSISHSHTNAFYTSMCAAFYAAGITPIAWTENGGAYGASGTPDITSANYVAYNTMIKTCVQLGFGGFSADIEGAGGGSGYTGTLAQWIAFQNQLTPVLHAIGALNMPAVPCNTGGNNENQYLHVDYILSMFYWTTSLFETGSDAPIYWQEDFGLGAYHATFGTPASPVIFGILGGPANTNPLSWQLAQFSQALSTYGSSNLAGIGLFSYERLSSSDWSAWLTWLTNTTPITPTYILKWAITPIKGTLPFTISFSGYLSRSSSSLDTGSILNGETIQLQYIPPGGTTWTNTAITTPTASDSSGYTGYFSSTFLLAEPWTFPGAWQFRAYYAGNVTKNLFGCDNTHKRRDLRRVNALIL
jgi:hypothetical protein